MNPNVTMNGFELYVFKLFLREKPRSKRGTFISRETRDNNLSFYYRLWLLRKILKGYKRACLLRVIVESETSFLELVSLVGRSDPGIYLRYKLDLEWERVIPFNWNAIDWYQAYKAIEN